MERLIEHLLKIKRNRKANGKEVDFMTMLHILSTIGGKYKKQGIISQEEYDSLYFQNCSGFNHICTFWEDW